MFLWDLAVFGERVMTPIIDPSQPLFSLYQPIKISHLLKTSMTTPVLFFLMSTGICIANIFPLALSFKPVWLLLPHLHGRFDLITAPLLLPSVPHPRGRTRVWEDILNSGGVHALVSISLWIQIHSFPGVKVAFIHVRGYLQLTGGQGFWSMPLSMYYARATQFW